MTESQAESISKDDLELLALLVACPSDDPIARRLGVSVRTVRRRVARIMDVLAVQNRFAAGVAAAQLGWVSHSLADDHIRDVPEILQRMTDVHPKIASGVTGKAVVVLKGLQCSCSKAVRTQSVPPHQCTP
ncbi:MULTISPECIES: hypothetical protein [Streptomyces]|uniref:HTH luxR-type domain-containing protein n=1 Tax=Streptomyces halstedii TaxID=1944 RepID=A0A6N9U500_STRHA|nr:MULTISPECIES: hypothetical protein [Streptomyces]MBV7673511.1 hypothetical protein [Streptomyces halstedii]NEA18914.1 hypothetical protein [Streptomyces halstedii]